MAETLTPTEEAQLTQTIEMFEVITQSQPFDYQSLEILKEAYSKLGRQADVIGTSKRIAEAYVQLGQLSSAILEYESVLQQSPDDPDVQKALAEIENRATNFAPPPEPDPEPEPEPIARTQAPSAQKAKPGAVRQEDIDDGAQAMRRLLVDGKLMSGSDFDMLWPAPDMSKIPEEVSVPFLQVLADKGLIPVDQTLKALCDKSRLPYLPIDKYDVDVDLARTFPREVCQRWCVLPFDRMSKTVLVATCNPFNKAAARSLEESSKNRLQFYLAPPGELVKVMKRIFR